MTESALARLEDTIRRVGEHVQAMQAANAELRGVIQKLTDELEELKQENCAKGELIEQLENDRLEIRSRVEKIMAKIAALEKPVRESSRS